MNRDLILVFDRHGHPSPNSSFYRSPSLLEKPTCWTEKQQKKDLNIMEMKKRRTCCCILWIEIVGSASYVEPFMHHNLWPWSVLTNIKQLIISFQDILLCWMIIKPAVYDINLVVWNLPMDAHFVRSSEITRHGPGNWNRAEWVDPVLVPEAFFYCNEYRRQIGSRKGSLFTTLQSLLAEQ